jgi:hypothetical protein
MLLNRGLTFIYQPWKSPGKDGWVLKSIAERVDCFERPCPDNPSFVNALGKGVIELSVKDIANFVWGKSSSFEGRHRISKDLDL